MAVSMRIANHPIVPTLAQMDSLLQTAEVSFGGQQAELIARGRVYARVLRERLNDASSDLISDSTLANAHSWTQQAVNELQQAVNMGNPNQLANNGMFVSAVDSFSQSLGQFPVSYPIENLTSQLDEAQQRVKSIHEIQLKAANDSRLDQDARTEEIAKFKDEFKRQLAKVSEQRRSAEKLLAALGGTATAHGYSETAEAEKASADLWRKITLGLAAATAIVALALFTYFHTPGYESYLRRGGVLLPFVLTTLYAGRQAAEHRKEEREARRLQLAFGSVNAYLSDVEDAQRAELKSQLSMQLFGSPSGGQLDQVSAAFPSSVELVRTIMEMATKRSP